MTDDNGAGKLAEELFREWWLNNSELGLTRSGIGFHAFTSGFNAGRKAEREYNWKAVAKICGVNPYTHRPCVEKVEEKFWCPVCVCAGKIRGGQDGE